MLLLVSGCQEQQEMRVSPNSYYILETTTRLPGRVWFDESPAFSRCSCDSATFCLTDEDVMIIHMIYAQNNQKTSQRITD